MALRKVTAPVIKDSTGLAIKNSIDALKASIDSEGSNLAPVESGNTATKAYVVGEHLVYNRILYIASQAIAIGDTLTPNTNITQVKVGSEIETINGSIATIGTGKLDTQDVATVEATSTASKAYAVGEYLIFNGRLHKATDDIDLGDTLTVGTNIALAKIGDELDNKVDNQEIATIETTSTASKAYTAGEYLIYGGSLCKVTADIDLGDALAIGTNIESAALADEVSTLNSAISAKNIPPLTLGSNVSGAAFAVKCGSVAFLIGELTPTAAIAGHGAVLVSGLPLPHITNIYCSIIAKNGKVIPCIIAKDSVADYGIIYTYYGAGDWDDRADFTIAYPCK